jgi:hypothetical protein
MEDSIKIYGFEYAYKGRLNAYRVIAHSEAEAMEKAAAMADGKFMGELPPVVPSVDIVATA